MATIRFSGLLFGVIVCFRREKTAICRFYLFLLASWFNWNENWKRKSRYKSCTYHMKNSRQSDILYKEQWCYILTIYLTRNLIGAPKHVQKRKRSPEVVYGNWLFLTYMLSLFLLKKHIFLHRDRYESMFWNPKVGCYSMTGKVTLQKNRYFEL